MSITKIISGAQTGADMAGLDAALNRGLQVGGTVPKGRRTETGALTENQMKRFNLAESESPFYPPRTLQNVLDSDGTVLFGNMESPGCRLTLKLCKLHGKPALENPISPEQFRAWAEKHQIQTLNVAGNRESKNPGIYGRTLLFLCRALEDLRP